jgi:hypothetical protein
MQMKQGVSFVPVNSKVLSARGKKQVGRLTVERGAAM